ncbi:hypothetical protein [Methylocucumis oryzae]|uniref:Uncharacterized protein n=1 Tax=Methylocucumis oryzae TaxID=1632867 RepID=A0A0F3IND4_9GAMM|nr:hypothetical protein [Methylocucumis oryzae]KJV08068.1 hypothetical protein VZ94_00475 [Methylocucumis oryzae]
METNEKIIAEIIPQLKPGDMIVLRNASLLNRQQFDTLMDSFRAAIQPRNISPITIIPLPSGIDIELLNPEEMKKHGWIKDK